MAKIWARRTGRYEGTVQCEKPTISQWWLADVCGQNRRSNLVEIGDVGPYPSRSSRHYEVPRANQNLGLVARDNQRRQAHSGCMWTLSNIQTESAQGTVVDDTSSLATLGETGNRPMSLRRSELPCHGRLLLSVDRGVARKEYNNSSVLGQDEGRLRPFRFSGRNCVWQRSAICVVGIPIICWEQQDYSHNLKPVPT